MRSSVALTSSPAAVAPAGNAKRWVLVASILASSMVFIDGTALSVALPALQADFATTGTNLLWVTNGFSLPLAALLLFGGALGDALGRRRVFILGIVAFTTASIACGFAGSIQALITARVAQGIGGALMIPGSLAMISTYFSPAERGKAIGAWSAFSVLATTLGPVLGGVLASAGLWRGVFLINLPLAIIALTLLMLKVPADARAAERKPVDGWGALFVSVGLAAINFGLIQWSTHSFSHPTVWVCVVVGAAAIAAFFSVQKRVAHPLLPLDVFASRTLTATSVLSFLFYMGFHGTLFFLPLNLIQVQGYPASRAGLTQVPLMILLVALSAWAGRLVDRRGPRLPLTLGPFITGCGFLALTIPGVTSGPGAFAATYLPGLLLVGVGLGMTATPLSTTMMLSVPAERLGLASGLNSSVTRLAGVFAIAVLGPFMLALFSHSLADRVAELHLPPGAAEMLRREAPKLGMVAPPAELTSESALAVKRAVQAAFVDSFRWTVGAAAGLCWLGALIAFRFLPARGARTSNPPGRGH